MADDEREEVGEVGSEGVASAAPDDGDLDSAMWVAKLEEEVAELRAKLDAVPEDVKAALEEVEAERARRRQVEEQLKEGQMKYITHQRSVAELRERHARELEALEAELHAIDDVLYDKEERERGVTVQSCNRIERLRSLRAREAGLLSTTSVLSEEKEKAEAEYNHIATELRLLQNEMVWLKRQPFVVCRVVAAERRRARERAPPRESLAVTVEDREDGGVPTRIELKLPGKKTVRHKFDAVLPKEAMAVDVGASVRAALTPAFDGLPVTLLLLSANSMVATAGHKSLMMSIANDLWTAAHNGTQEDGWVWSMQLCAVEMKAHAVRDLLNTDSEYIRVQTCFSPQSIRHDIEALRAGPVVADCANPVTKQADTRRLLDLAIRNRSTSPEGELRGHVAYIFTVTGTKGQFGGSIRGSVTVVDVATDSDLPIELPRGASPDNAKVVQAAMEVREKERIYVKRSLTQLSNVFRGPSPMYDGMVRVSNRPNDRARFEPGDEVEVVGLTAQEFVNLNGSRGMVGKVPHEVKGRVMVDFPGDYSLPFLQRNLIHIRPAQHEDPFAPHNDTTHTSPPPGARGKAARGPAEREPLVTLLTPSLEHGLLSVVMNLPSQGCERSAVTSLDLCSRISKYQLGPLANQIHTVSQPQAFA